MSTINAQNYGDGTDSVPASAVLEGTAKAWAKIGWGSPTIEASYNIASITDNSVGDTSATYTNAMTSTAENSPVVGCRFNNSSGTGAYINTTSVFNANGFTNLHFQNGANADPTHIFASTFGSLA